MIRLASIGYSSTKFCTIFMPIGAGLLRVKLNAEDVVLFEHGRVRKRVVGGRGGRSGHRHVVAMREVDMRLRRNALQQSRRLGEVERVPAHVRYSRIGREALDGAFEDAESRHFRRLATSLKQRLHAETDAEIRHTRADALHQRLTERRARRAIASTARSGQLRAG